MEETTLLHLEPIVPPKNSPILTSEERALIEACANTPNRYTAYKIPEDHRLLIKKIIVMGDSLSDRGTLFKRMLFGIIPMSLVSGLHKTSPDGRFTNGLTWGDFFISSLGGNFEINTTKHRLHTGHLGNDDISDALISADRQIKHHKHKKNSVPKKRYALCEDDIINGEKKRMGPKLIHNSDEFELDNNRTIIYHGNRWARTYAEGGLMAYDYRCQITTNIKKFFTRSVLSTLEDKRKELVAFDKSHNVSAQEKQETIVIEWSGANDLITVNDGPTKKDSDKAIAARINNIRKLIEAGYKHFVLFNLPDLGLTPRFQARSQKERDNAVECSAYFNQQLVKAAAELAKKHPYCVIKVFDIDTPFKEMYKKPQEYGFDPAKLKQPYTKSDEFVNSKGLSPAKGFLFWDDVHPTADAHAWLGSKFYDEITKSFHFVEPNSKTHPLSALSEQEILARYRESYAVQLKQDKGRFLGGIRTRTHIDFEKASLREVIHHGLSGGNRTKNTLKNLGFFDQNNKPVMDIPALAKVVLEDRRAAQSK